MNLLPAEGKDGAVYLGGQKLCDASQSGPVTAGIRPEDFVLDPQGALAINVDIIEELGAHRLLHGKLGQEQVTVHVSNESNVSTGPLNLSIKPDAVCIFDAETGRRL